MSVRRRSKASGRTKGASPGRTLIRTYRIGGIVWHVYRADPAHVPALHDGDRVLEGVTDTSTAEIHVREGLSPSLERDAIAHELLHAFLYATGLAHVIEARIGAGYADFEEVLVRVATPHLVGFFESQKRRAA